ncbi:MAG: hypothetical protein ACK2UH_04950, partial [Candidatus Promineifilaceae bacterium]
TQATVGTPPTSCTLPAPTLDGATPGHTEVALAWSAAAGATGYNVYYDQAGKAQFIADNGNTLTYLDTGLTNGVEYCYKLTAYDATCESGFSNILCATPQNQGQTTDPAGVSTMETGLYTGKGNARTFTPAILFTAGDDVVIHAHVVDNVSGLPLAGATVDLLITGPESLALTSAASDAAGLAEAIWNTSAAKGNNPGTTPGTYTVTVKGIAANGYHWDGVTTSTTFTIQ